MITYEEATRQRDELEARVKACSADMAKFPTLANGLHADEVKFTPAYAMANNALKGAVANLREFNKFYVPTFKAELKAERKRRRG